MSEAVVVVDAGDCVLEGIEGSEHEHEGDAQEYDPVVLLATGEGGLKGLLHGYDGNKMINLTWFDRKFTTFINIHNIWVQLNTHK